MKSKIQLFVSSITFMLLLFPFSTGYSQFVYNSSYNCFLLLSANNYNTCSIYMHEYSYGKPKPESSLYADLTYENGRQGVYKKHFIDLGYANARQFYDLYIKSSFVDNKLSLLKIYNNEGNIDRKFTYTFKSDNTVDVTCTDKYGDKYSFNNSLKYDPSGSFTVSFIQNENYGYQEFKYKKKDTLNTSYMYYQADNHVSDGSIDSYEQFMYGVDYNILTYKKTVELYSDEGTQRKFSVEDRFQLRYKYDEYKNPVEVILYGQSGEPELMFEFRYSN